MKYACVSAKGLSWKLSFILGCSFGLAASPGLGTDVRSTDLPAAPLKEWTVMVFMNGKNNLEEDALDNFRQMAAVARPDDQVNVVVELGRLRKNTPTNTDWGGVKRYLVKQGT